MIKLRIQDLIVSATDLFALFDELQSFVFYGRVSPREFNGSVKLPANLLSRLAATLNSGGPTCLL